MGRPFIDYYISPLPPPRFPSDSGDSTPSSLPDLESNTSGEEPSLDPYSIDDRDMNYEVDMTTEVEDQPPSPVRTSEDPDSRSERDFAQRAPTPAISTHQQPRYDFRDTTRAQSGSFNPLPLGGVAPHRAPTPFPRAVQPPAALPDVIPASHSSAIPVNPTTARASTRTVDSLLRSPVLGERNYSADADDAYHAAGALFPPFPDPEIPPARPYRPNLHSPAPPALNRAVAPPVDPIRPYMLAAPPSISPAGNNIIIIGDIIPDTLNAKLIYPLNQLRIMLTKVEQDIGHLPHNMVNSIAGQITSIQKMLKALRRNTFATVEDYYLIKTEGNSVSPSYSHTITPPNTRIA